MPRFSIIIPVYDLENHILKTLRSIEAQSFNDYEVIIVDDGSTDRSAALCSEWCNDRSRFRLYRKQNGGVSSARNEGLEHASGDYVWFIDGDDAVHPESLRMLDSVIASHPGCDYVSFRYDWTGVPYEDRHFLPLHPEKTERFYGVEKEEFCRMICQTPIAVCCICIRRESIGSLRFEPICTSEDSLFALQLTFQSELIVLWDEAPYFYCRRSDSATRKKNTLPVIRDYVKYLSFLMRSKGLRNGWGDFYIAYQLYRFAIPHFYRCLFEMESKSERVLLLPEFWQVLDDFVKEFPEHVPFRIAFLSKTRSLPAAWLFFKVRDDFQKIAAAHPFLVKLLRVKTAIFKGKLS